MSFESMVAMLAIIMWCFTNEGLLHSHGQSGISPGAASGSILCIPPVIDPILCFSSL